MSPKGQPEAPEPPVEVQVAEEPAADAVVPQESPEVIVDVPPEAVVEPVTPAPKNVFATHPAAPLGRVTDPVPEGVEAEYFVGMWGSQANYGCPYCSYATIEGSGAVELHILARIDTGDLKHSQALALQE